MSHDEEKEEIVDMREVEAVNIAESPEPSIKAPPPALLKSLDTIERQKRLWQIYMLTTQQVPPFQIMQSLSCDEAEIKLARAHYRELKDEDANFVDFILSQIAEAEQQLRSLKSAQESIRQWQAKHGYTVNLSDGSTRTHPSIKHTGTLSTLSSQIRHWADQLRELWRRYDAARLGHSGAAKESLARDISHALEGSRNDKD